MIEPFSFIIIFKKKKETYIAILPHEDNYAYPWVIKFIINLNQQWLGCPGVLVSQWTKNNDVPQQFEVNEKLMFLCLYI